jgi:hypothetical protein
MGNDQMVILRIQRVANSNSHGASIGISGRQIPAVGAYFLKAHHVSIIKAKLWMTIVQKKE